jgi:hypothetical protein
MTDTFSFRGYFGRAMNTFCHLGERNSKSTNLESEVRCHNVHAELSADCAVMSGECCMHSGKWLHPSPTNSHTHTHTHTQTSGGTWPTTNRVLVAKYSHTFIRFIKSIDFYKLQWNMYTHKHRVKLTCTQNLILGSFCNHTIGIYYEKWDTKKWS